ncbi:MAG: hypothetical protein AVDCRST_MAG56-3273, partial [uncultured Cytophagales bacterium]
DAADRLPPRQLLPYHPHGADDSVLRQLRGEDS